jgi:hypothetical protein
MSTAIMVEKKSVRGSTMCTVCPTHFYCDSIYDVVILVSPGRTWRVSVKLHLAVFATSLVRSSARDPREQAPWNGMLASPLP